ncbi:MAG: hypothetical protein H6Q65_2581, partial [Firmicutes bacterium]|nr:hypothetical protein [Bacillota bacterium]
MFYRTQKVDKGVDQMTERQELSAKKLRFHCDPEVFSFATTAEVPPLDTVIGQERAVK